MQLDENRRRDLHSGEYVQTLDKVPTSRIARLLPLIHFQPGCRLVDLASGTGVLAELVHDRVQSYEGVDFSPELVDLARRRAAEKGISNATFYCEDIVAFCARHREEYDIVTAFDFSEHVYDDDFLRIFGGAYSILKSGGRLYVYTPNLDFFYERMKGIGLAKQFPQHIAVRNPVRNLDLLLRCGFRRDRILCSYPPHFNVFRHLHPLSKLPGVGRWFRAKLFFECVK